MSNGWAHYLVKPAERQLQICADFHAKTAADFPNSALVQYSWNRPNSFLGPLIDEHLEYIWRFESTGSSTVAHGVHRLPAAALEEQLEALLPEANAIFDWVKQKGAANANSLSADDVKFPVVRPKRGSLTFSLCLSGFPRRRWQRLPARRGYRTCVSPTPASSPWRRARKTSS